MSWRLGPVVFVGWSLFVWGTRLRNIASDGELAGFELVWRTSLAVALFGFALLAGAALIAERFSARVSRTQLRGPIAALAGLTVFTWVLRGISIALADHSAAFVAVHLVLAVVSIGLAAWAWKSLTTKLKNAMMQSARDGDQPGKASDTMPSSTSKFTRASS